MQGLTMSKWLFIRKHINGFLLNTKKQKKEVFQSGILYHNITELPLYIFIKCICDNDLSGLGTGNVEEVWNNMYAEYLDLIKDKDQTYKMKLIKEIEVLSLKLSKIQLIVTILSEQLKLKHAGIEVVDEKLLLEKLKKEISITGKFDMNDAKEYMNSLNMIINRAKRWIVEIENKKSELEKLKPKDGEGVVDRAHFDGLLIKLSKYMQFHVDKLKITVSEFINMIVDMRNYYDQQQKLYARSGTGK